METFAAGLVSVFIIGVIVCFVWFTIENWREILITLLALGLAVSGIWGLGWTVLHFTQNAQEEVHQPAEPAQPEENNL